MDAVRIRPGQAIEEGGDVLSIRRASSIDTLIAQKRLDVGQVLAAFRFRQAYEIELEAKRESIGFSEWSAPGGPGQSLAEKRTQATADLARSRDLCGAYVYAVLGQVCGQGYHLSDLYAARRARDTHTDMLCIHLTMLAKAWSLM